MGMKIAALYWRKRYWLLIHNKVKSEQYFAVTSAKRVAVFQASSNLVREEASSQLPNKGNKCSTSKDQNVYEKKDAVNENDTLI